MALPFLALGLGLIGGREYLNRKGEVAKTESMLTDFQPQFTGLMGNEKNALYQSRLDNLQSEADFWGTTDPDDAQSLLDDYRADMATHQQQLAKQEANFQTNNRSAINDVRSVEALHSERMDGVQKEMRKSKEIMMKGKYSAMDLQSMIFGMAKAQNGGGKISDADVQNVINATPWMQRMMNRISTETTGTGNKKLGAELYQTLESIYASELTEYEESQARLNELIESYQGQGYLDDERQYRNLQHTVDPAWDYRYTPEDDRQKQGQGGW